jgi:hypothetical protein
MWASAMTVNAFADIMTEAYDCDYLWLESGIIVPYLTTTPPCAVEIRPNDPIVWRMIPRDMRRIQIPKIFSGHVSPPPLPCGRVPGAHYGRRSLTSVERNLRVPSCALSENADRDHRPVSGAIQADDSAAIVGIPRYGSHCGYRSRFAMQAKVPIFNGSSRSYGVSNWCI